MLTSNLADVIKRVAGIQPAIERAVVKATAPKYWEPRLKLAATKAIRACWTGETDTAKHALYERMTPRIVNTLMAEVAGPITRFIMTGLNWEEGTVDKAVREYNQTLTPKGRESRNARLDIEAVQNLQQVRDQILEWVRTVKQKDERDAGLTDEQIADRIEVILGLRPSSHPRNAEMDAGAESLQGAIQKWMAGEENQGKDGKPPATALIDPAVVHEWLEAVMIAWRNLFQTALPGQLDYQVTMALQNAAGFGLK